MAETLLYVIIVVVAALVIATILNRVRTGRGAEHKYVPGESELLDEEYGNTYVKSWEEIKSQIEGAPTIYRYKLETELHGVVFKDYLDHDLFDLNKHLGFVGRSFIISTKAVNMLAGKFDVVKLQEDFYKLREDFEVLQAEHNRALANKEAEIEKRIDSVKDILKAMPRTKTGVR